MICKIENISGDLSEINDAALVELSKLDDRRDAMDALLVRYREWTNQLINRLARNAGLNEHDAQDAAQDAIFAIIRATERYDNSKGCTFKTFLHRVVSDRFKDFVKRECRARKWTGCSQEVDDQPQGANRYSTDAAHDDNPLWKSHWNEMCSRLGSFVDQLEVRSRNFLTALLAGTSLRAAGEHAGLSYDQAKRMRRKLRVELADLFDYQS